MEAKKKTGAPKRSFESYLAEPGGKATALADYMATPAEAFLRYMCDAYDAFEHCKNKFTKKDDGAYMQDSDDSLRHIAVAILATTMGHFETYQKCLFAGVFERTQNFETFDPKAVLRALDNPTIELARFCAYRGANAPVGFSVADSLSLWHSAKTVNSYFKAMYIKQDVFSNDDIEMLDLLWQLRHSVVHTAAWLTVPDSQKVKQVHGKGDRAIAFEHTFINALSRRFHKLVKAANARLKQGIIPLLGATPPKEVLDDLDSFLLVKSPKQVWLN